MQSFIIPIVVLSIPALCLSLFRKTWWWPLLCWLVGMVAGVVMGWLSVGDVWTLPFDTQLGTDAVPIVVYLIWSALVGSALRWTPTSDRDALLLGVSVGTFAAAWALQPDESVTDGGESDERVLWLAVAGSLLHSGALLSGSYFLSSSFLWLILPLFTVIMVLLSDRNAEIHGNGLPKVLPFAGVTLLSSTIFPQWTVPLLLGTSLIWGALCGRSFPWKRLLWIVGMVLTVNLSVASGLGEVGAWGLEELPMEFHNLLPLGMLVATTVLSMLIGVVPMAIFGVALFERTMDLPSIGLSNEPLLVAYGLGLVFGNVYPWVSHGIWLQNCGRKGKSWLAISALGLLIVGVVL